MYFFGGKKPANSYLHEKEGHSICLEGPSKLHILYFSFYLRHLSTVFMFLENNSYISNLNLSVHM